MIAECLNPILARLSKTSSGELGPTNPTVVDCATASNPNAVKYAMFANKVNKSTIAIVAFITRGKFRVGFFKSPPTKLS